jgi:HEAT repeat protein
MTLINRLLNVRPGEWPRLLFISTILILSNIGTIWGMNVAYAAFLKQAGLQSGQQTLIWVLLLSSIVSILSLSIYTAFVDRTDNNKLFIYIILVGGVIKLSCVILAEMDLGRLAFPILYVLSLAWLASWNAHFPTYVNDLFDLQSAKRTLPTILATGRIGGALAGFTLTFFTTTMHLPGKAFVWIWLVTDVLVMGTLWAKPYLLRDQKNISADRARPADSSSRDKGTTSYLQSVKEGLNFTRQSSFLRWMATGTILLAILVTLLEYHANGILAPRFKDYAGFLGRLDGISNLIALIILLFMLGRMTKSWGIGNTSLVFPFISLIISGGLVGSGTVALASLTYLNRKGLRISLQGPIESLLYNAVPLRVKGRARTFVGGLLTPAGVILGVAVLLLDLWKGSSFPWLVPGGIALLSLFYLLSTFAIRYQYTQALVKMLEEEDYSFLLAEEASELVVADTATLQRLQKKLDESTTHEMRIFMTQLIAQVGGAGSLDILIPAVRSAQEARTRAAMLNVISAAEIGSGKARELYVNFLEDPDSQVRNAAATGLEYLLGHQDPWLQNQWLAMLNDSDPQVSFHALQSLAETGKFYSFEPAVKKLNSLLESKSVDDKKNAIEILGTTSQPQSIEQLLTFMDDENDQIRLEAILNFEKIKLPLGNALDEIILQKANRLLEDPVAGVRLSALKIVGTFSTRENYPSLVYMLSDKNAQVRTAAVDILVRIGKAVIPLLQNELKSEEPQSRKIAGVVLSRINPRQFGPLIDQSVIENLKNIYQNISFEQALMPFEHHRSVRALLAVLREQNDQWINEILYLFSAVHDSQTLQIVGESLHSDSPDTRNLALEVLESLTSPQTASLIASLFDSSLSRSQLLQMGEEILQIEKVDKEQALRKLLSLTKDKIIPPLTLYTMGDIGQELKAVAETNNSTSPLAEKIESMLESATLDPDPLTKQSAQASLMKIQGGQIESEGFQSVSTIERMVILKEVPFFRNVPAHQLKLMAEVCEEKIFKEGTYIFKAGDVGKGLYIIAEGQVGIEQEKRGNISLLATLKKDSYFGEMALFDNSPRSASAVVMKDSILLELNPAPVTTLTMQNPNLALEFINTLSQRIRETSNLLAETTRSRPRELHKLYDQFG